MTLNWPPISLYFDYFLNLPLQASQSFFFVIQLKEIYGNHFATIIFLLVWDTLESLLVKK